MGISTTNKVVSHLGYHPRTADIAFLLVDSTGQDRSRDCFRPAKHCRLAHRIIRKPIVGTRLTASTAVARQSTLHFIMSDHLQRKQRYLLVSIASTDYRA